MRVTKMIKILKLSFQAVNINIMLINIMYNYYVRESFAAYTYQMYVCFTRKNFKTSKNIAVFPVKFRSLKVYDKFAKRFLYVYSYVFG